MKLRKNSGRVVYSPLSYIFQVLEIGGSPMQKYDATTSSFIPNREATPLVLQPSLIISDPDGIVSTADYVRHMNSVAWTLTFNNGRTEVVMPTHTAGGDTLYENVADAASVDRLNGYGRAEGVGGAYVVDMYL